MGSGTVQTCAVIELDVSLRSRTLPARWYIDSAELHHVTSRDPLPPNALPGRLVLVEWPSIPTIRTTRPH